MLAVYRFAESFPDREKYGLGHQMRRVAVSRLAEGLGNRSQAEKTCLLNIVGDSLEECRIT